MDSACTRQCVNGGSVGNTVMRAVPTTLVELSSTPEMGPLPVTALNPTVRVMVEPGSVIRVEFDCPHAGLPATMNPHTADRTRNREINVPFDIVFSSEQSYG
jgi:hypothetical protein